MTRKLIIQRLLNGSCSALIAFAVSACDSSDDPPANPDAGPDIDARANPDIDASPAPDAGPVPDGIAPSVTIQFPPPVSRTDSDTLTLRGTASHTGEIADIRIAGVSATSDDGFATWRVTVPLSVGTGQLVVESEDAAGDVDTDAARVTTTYTPIGDFSFGPMALDTASQRAIVYDAERVALVAVDLVSNVRTPVSGDGVGAGPALTGAADITLNGTGTSALVIADDGAFTTVALSTGDRASIPTGTGPGVQTPSALTWDDANGRALVLDDGVDALVAVDLATGDSIVISSSSDGLQPALSQPTDLILDAANGRVLVIDKVSDALMAIDLTTGMRTELSGDTVGAGAIWYTPQALTWDTEAGRVLVFDGFLFSGGFTNGDAVVSVDLSTGDRQIISFTGYVYDGYVGTGPRLPNAHSMALDATGDRVIIADDRRMLAVQRVSGDRSFPWPGQVLAAPVALALTGADSMVVVDTSIDGLVEVDIATGAHSLLWDNNNAIGEIMVAPRDIVIDATRNRWLVPDYFDADALDYVTRIFAIDMTTGARTELSASGSGISLQNIPGIALDAAGDHMLLTNYRFADIGLLSTRDLIRYDLAAGTREAFSRVSNNPNNTIGTGPGFQTPGDIIIGPDAEHALVLDTHLDVVFTVDLTTGDRTLVTSAYLGTGPVPEHSGGLALDSARGRVVITDRQLDAVLAVELATGDRTILSAADTGSGPAFREPGRVETTEAGVGYIADSGLGAIVALDLLTGDRVLVSQ